MKEIVKPFYILLFVTLPQLLLLGYLALAAGVPDIKSLVLPGIVSLLLMCIFSVYALVKRSQISTDARVFTAISVIYTLYTVCILISYEYLFRITGFVSPRLIFIILCMIPVLYGIFGMTFSTNSDTGSSEKINYTVGAIAVPLLWFVVMNIINGINLNAVLIIFITAGIYAIALLAAKMLFAWKCGNAGSRSSNTSSKRYYVITVFVSLLLPLGGLAINQGNAGFWSSDSSVGMFGDFSNPAFYIIAVINGLLMLLPAVEDRKLRLLLFYLKAVCYTYILYFFIVFLPILPMGMLGLIFYGLGIFVLAPSLAAIWQGRHIIREWSALSKTWGTSRIAAVFCAGIITLPLCLISTFWGDRGNFDTAIQYLEYNNTEVTESVDLVRLKRTLKTINGNYDLTRGWTGFDSGNTPLISSFYTAFVLDGKVISQHNMQVLENLFLDSGHNLRSVRLSNPAAVNNNIILKAAEAKTEYDKEIGVYRSWVNLTMENPSNVGNGEYVTTFKLPEGAYISDYYLNILGERKEGILTDRRAALFIYQKIVNTRRDPGLLHYIGENTLELRVFPFNSSELRHTGFEVLHNRPFDLNLDNRVIHLGQGEEPRQISVEGAVLISPSQKSGLKHISRTPKYHFIVDSSKNSDIGWHIEQIEEYTKANNIAMGEVLFASYKIESYSLSDMRQAGFKPECGFNLDRAVRMILSEEGDNSFPIIIVVSDNMQGAVLPENIYPLSGRFPESPYYYSLNHNLTLTPYSYEDNKAGSRLKSPVIESVLDFNGIYVSDNDESDLILENRQLDGISLTGNQYKDALLLDAAQRRYLLNGKTEPLELIRSAFRSRVLTPQTAFIVVETAEQEKELLDLQERLLSSSEQTPTVTLDEPQLLTCAAIVLLAIFLFKIRRKTVCNQGGGGTFRATS